jgi:hypothetical protein
VVKCHVVINGYVSPPIPMIGERPNSLLRRALQTLVLFFAVTQMAAPLLHAHYGEGSVGAAGLHLHLESVEHSHGNWASAGSEVHDREARTLSAPVEHFRDESLRLLDLPATPGASRLRLYPQRLVAKVVFIPITATAAQPFPKPLPLAPPASV